MPASITSPLPPTYRVPIEELTADVLEALYVPDPFGMRGDHPPPAVEFLFRHSRTTQTDEDGRELYLLWSNQIAHSGIVTPARRRIALYPIASQQVAHLTGLIPDRVHIVIGTDAANLEHNAFPERFASIDPRQASRAQWATTGIGGPPAP